MLASDTTASTSTTSPAPVPLPLLFTCLACEIAFDDADEQRTHYRSDHHRYNMKRRVAGLPPVDAQMYNGRVLEKRAETTSKASAQAFRCEPCSKSYTTENMYLSHLESRKHKDATLRANTNLDASSIQQMPQHPSVVPQPSGSTEEEVASKVVHATPMQQLTSRHCLFCTHVSSSLATSLEHMSTVHSFFIPSSDYLVDVEGLISHLASKIMTENACIFCNARSREFRTLEAVRRHMVDKGHCKMAYEEEGDILEVLEYYDFSSTFPEALKLALAQAATSESDQDEKEQFSLDAAEWESASSSDLGEDELLTPEFTVNDSSTELVLSSGTRIRHRSEHRPNTHRSTALVRIRPASFKPTPHLANDPNSGAALVRQIISDKSNALVPTRGGLGAFGSGTEVMRARNRGEARDAGRITREFRDVVRRQHFKTKVAFKANSQKFFRDPILGVLGA